MWRDVASAERRSGVAIEALEPAGRSRWPLGELVDAAAPGYRAVRHRPVATPAGAGTANGLTWLGDLNGATELPSLTTVEPTVMSSISQPPSLTPPSLT